MKTEYSFKGLMEMADYFQLTADTRRKSSTTAKPTRQKQLIAEACAWEAAAYVVRNATLEEIRYERLHSEGNVGVA